MHIVPGIAFGDACGRAVERGGTAPWSGKDWLPRGAAFWRRADLRRAALARRREETGRL